MKASHQNPRVVTTEKRENAMKKVLVIKIKTETEIEALPLAIAIDQEVTVEKEKKIVPKAAVAILLVAEVAVAVVVEAAVVDTHPEEAEALKKAAITAVQILALQETTMAILKEVEIAMEVQNRRAKKV